MALHAGTIVCLIGHYTGKERDVSPYTEAYKVIKSVPIVQAATPYNNMDTGKTMILILNEAIWMGGQMEHTLINPNQLRAYKITVQDNPFDPAPIFISAEDNKFTVPLSSKGTVLGVATRTPTDQVLQTCLHVILSSEHKWDPQNIWFLKASQTEEEELSRTIGAVMTQDKELLPKILVEHQCITYGFSTKTKTYISKLIFALRQYNELKVFYQTKPV
jgi:hypothetical protein